MATSVVSGKPVAMRGGSLLRKLVLLFALAGLGVAAGAGIVKATDDGGVRTVRESKVIFLPEEAFADYSVYLVRDQAQAEWLESQISMDIGIASEMPAYQILIAGTPEGDAVAQERIGVHRERGARFEVSDLRGYFPKAATPAPVPADGFRYGGHPIFELEPVAFPELGIPARDAVAMCEGWGQDEAIGELLRTLGYCLLTKPAVP